MRFAVWAAIFAFVAEAQQGPRVLLFYDMEGLSGINRQAQTMFGRPDYAEGRVLLTEDVNAAIRGLKAAGAGEIVVTDAHGSGNSGEPDILLDRLDKRARFEFKNHDFAPYLDMPGPEFQAIVCVGMHARGGAPGFLAHTYTTEPRWLIDGREINETEIIAYSAARFGVPVIMVSGDDVLQKEIAERLPGAQYGLVKRAKGRGSADLLPLAEARSNIEEAARRGLERMSTVRAFPKKDTYQWQIAFQNEAQADRAANYPGLTRDTAVTLGLGPRSFADGYQLMTTLIRMATTERLQVLLEVVRKQPNGDKILEEYRSALNARWFEDQPIPAAAPPAPKKTRFHGAN
jgi:D-amino peptidase